MPDPRKLETIAEAWEGFGKAVIPLFAPPEQWIEMRRAFYAGAWFVLWCDGHNEEAGVDVLEALVAECEAFKAAVEKGEA